MTQNENFIDYSVIKQFYSATTFRNFSIKYVIEGVEHYKVNDVDFKLKNDEYLLAGLYSKGTVLIDSKEDVRGICIDLVPEIISEVVANYLDPNASTYDLNGVNFLTSHDFPENKYKAATTRLGAFLQQIEPYIKNANLQSLTFTKEFYYAIVQCLVADYIPLYKPFQRVKAIKNDTKKDLFRKLLLAKEHLDSIFLNPTSIAEIAQHNGFSEYHFFRLFKNAFEISPYQYMLKKRLQYAHKILKAQHHSVSDTAILSGFNDVHNFSRAFKKLYGKAPSKCIF
jgi:AraC family transcriptional regulator